jgi:hypothetical protein
MIDLSGWGFLVAVIVGWASLLFLTLAFLAAAARARRGEGLRVARVLSHEHDAPGGQYDAPGYEHGIAYNEPYWSPGSHRGRSGGGSRPVRRTQ